MIEGIKIDVTSEELKKHILNRASDHKVKAAGYTVKVNALAESGIEDQPGTSVDPIRQLRHKIKEHENKAAFFFFMAEHLVEDETYRLDEGDLSRLEIAALYF